MSINTMGKARKYPAVVGEGEDGGQGNTDDLLKNPEVQKLIQAKLDEEVAGLKKKNSDLIAQEKKFKEQMSQYEGIDLEKIKNLQKQMAENEEMRLLAEGKTEEVVARRVELLKKDYEAQLNARESKIKEYENTLSSREEALRQLRVDGAIREAYVSLDYEPAALDDVIRKARDVFIMGEDGKVIPRDEHGNLIFGKDGKSNITASEWLQNLAEKKPYLRKPSKGGGATGNRGYGSVDTSKMTSTQKIAQGLKDMGL